MRRYFSLTSVAVILAGCGTSNPLPSNGPTTSETTSAPSTRSLIPPDIKDACKSYGTLQLMTQQPIRLSQAIIVDCGPSSFQLGSQVDRGPHRFRQIKVFMNDIAATSFNEHARQYPVGALIMKEKLPLASADKQEVAEKRHSELAGMLKRNPGYDPKHGDWEYFYAESPEKIETGRISSCVDCHSNASSRGYVFGDWAR